MIYEMSFIFNTIKKRPGCLAAGRYDEVCNHIFGILSNLATTVSKVKVKAIKTEK